MKKLIEVKNLDDIKEGDNLIITGDGLVDEIVKARKIKVSKIDGVEVIFDLKMNRFFNLGMYLDGKSWVKNLTVIR